MNAARLGLLVIAVGLLPFALGPWNGARVVGVLAIVAFIVLTIAAAPSKRSTR